MDYTENDLRAAAKALTDVVAPALDPNDPLAREQLRLVVDYIEFLRARLDLIPARERFELDHHARMGRALVAAGGAGPEPLLAAVERGEAVHADPGATPAQRREATADIAEAIRDLVRSGAGGDPELARAYDRIILDAGDERIALERSWFRPFGFDPAPGELRPLQELLGLTI